MNNSTLFRKLNKRAAYRRSIENGDIPRWFWVALGIMAILLCNPQFI